MRQIADDVWHVPLSPRDTVNAYILGDVLVDAGYQLQGGRAVAAARERGVTAHALTHAHLDHAGGSARVIRELGLDGLAVGAVDAADVRAGGGELPPQTPGPLKGVARRLSAFPPSPVARELREGDVVGPGFVVLDVPGHSPGHVAYWREADRLLIAGDVYFNMHLLTTVPGLRQPPGPFTVDRAQNRRSMRRIAELEPSIVGFGHGPLVRDAAPKLAAAVARLPRD
ncbi:MBL fold metallo-hydrolase [Baekduia alba]|uniref:MBL fold metallo-hydrolase n=1 Tax=Baekduia alba TaxID=2997333 RepID=UPI0023407F27|nr:MBL fold metallo-hydrolase [Baekduia alba]